MMMVRIKAMENAVGLLIETHILPITSKLATPGAPQQGGIAAFGVVVVGTRFIITPLNELEPLLEPPHDEEPASEEDKDKAPPGFPPVLPGIPVNAGEDEQRSTTPQTGVPPSAEEIEKKSA